MDKSKVNDCFYELGFQPIEVSDNMYVICYEGNVLRYIYDEEDSFFSLSRICEFEIDDEEKFPFVNEVINETNSKVKYTKTFHIDESVWISYESKVYSEEHFADMVEFAIHIVEATEMIFNSLLVSNIDLDEDDE